MTHETNDAATSNVLAWSAHAANMPVAEEEVSSDADEPPEPRQPASSVENCFKRTAIRRPSDTHTSLLTKALQQHQDDDSETRPNLADRGRRRSMTSNVSLASTTELTCDTGFTSPSRTNSPSPPLPEFRLLQLSVSDLEKKKAFLDGPVIKRDLSGELTPKVEHLPKEEAPRKRCISFACTAKPKEAPTGQVPQARVAAPVVAKSPPSDGAPKRSCIKFACQAPGRATKNNPPPAQPTVRPVTPPKQLQPRPSDNTRSPSAIRKPGSAAVSPSPRPGHSRKTSTTPVPPRPKKWFTANPSQLPDCVRFHEFASSELHEDDWIRQAVSTHGGKITINDTLTKENAIRKLGTEAEEEAEQEERDDEETVAADEDADIIDDEEDNEEDNEEEDEVIEDDLSGYGSDDEDGSEGYNSDEETGFGASDDEDDGLHLWTPGRPRLLGETPVVRRASFGEQSDDSIGLSSVRAVHGKTRRIRIRPGTPELPDSTDFVCGTLDEDRPMEDAYISCLAARRRENTHLIPQDIDPSFPASDPENDEEEERYNPVHHDSDEEVWLHGEMDDLHHEGDRRSRKKKGDHASPPKRYHSPPPKRLHSPLPKARGRSPRRLFDRHSPRHLRSPPPAQTIRSPPASPHSGNGAIAFKDLGSRPGATFTKSLPRPAAMFPPQMRHHHCRKSAAAQAKAVRGQHLRGAIDIVKGLQQKRQRRREKFYQVYCHRARKGQIPERPKHRPGQGAERMRELGLLMAGKIDHGNYVLSV